MPKSPYSQTPVVPKNQIAGTNPITGPKVGSYASPTVPEKIGVAHGLGTLEKPFRHGVVRGSHGYGHPPHAKKGNYRLSGHPNAHMVGSNRGKPYNVGRP
jgi:hypothetical protein